MAREKTYPIRLTKGELDLLFSDLSSALGVGAAEENPEFQTIHDKVVKVLQGISGDARSASPTAKPKQE